MGNTRRCNGRFPYNGSMSISITSTAIASACHTPAVAAIGIEVVAQSGSTNADLLARVGRQDDDTGVTALTGPTLLLALEQTAGRGRAGRRWLSDTGSLTFSLAWPCRQPIAGLLGLPLAIGVAVADVLAARRIEVALKWPNDILLAGRKLAGILIETTTGASTAGATSATDGSQRQIWAVIGVGMNLLDASGDAPGIAVPDIAALPATDRNVLLAELLDALVSSLQQFDQAGLTPFVARWNALHAHAGQRVDILDQGRTLHSGVALGVDASGRLLLETGTPAQVVAIVAGDVSLRANQEAAHAVAD